MISLIRSYETCIVFMQGFQEYYTMSGCLKTKLLLENKIPNVLKNVFHIIKNKSSFGMKME